MCVCLRHTMKCTKLDWLQKFTIVYCVCMMMHHNYWRPSIRSLKPVGIVYCIILTIYFQNNFWSFWSACSPCVCVHFLLDPPSFLLSPRNMLYQMTDYGKLPQDMCVCNPLMEIQDVWVQIHHSSDQSKVLTGDKWLDKLFSGGMQLFSTKTNNVVDGIGALSHFI